MNSIEVYTDRTNVIQINLGMDVSGDTFLSQIRATQNKASSLIATWGITFLTDGTDGMLKLTLDNSVTATLSKTTGWMDLKRTSGGEPIQVFAPIPVKILDVVTA